MGDRLGGLDRWGLARGGLGTHVVGRLKESSVVRDWWVWAQPRDFPEGLVYFSILEGAL